jgi:hypothetical protein
VSEQIRGAAVICAAILLMACTSEEPLPPVHASEPKDVSLVQLVANPSEWHGKLVRVIGFCHLEFEGDVLYLHRQDFEQAILKNGVWLELPATGPGSHQDLSDQYVLVEAVFDADDRGHLGANSGALKSVRRIERWPSRREFQHGPPKPRG